VRFAVAACEGYRCLRCGARLALGGAREGPDGARARHEGINGASAGVLACKAQARGTSFFRAHGACVGRIL